MSSNYVAHFYDYLGVLKFSSFQPISCSNWPAAQKFEFVGFPSQEPPLYRECEGFRGPFAEAVLSTSRGLSLITRTK